MKTNKQTKESQQINLKLTDGSWRNGIVNSVTPDFFLFIDNENKRLEPFFFLQVRGVDPFSKEVKDEKKF
jgi:hypothetical protein